MEENQLSFLSRHCQANQNMHNSQDESLRCQMDSFVLKVVLQNASTVFPFKSAPDTY